MIIAAFPGMGKTTLEEAYPHVFKDTPTEDLVEQYGWTPMYYDAFKQRVIDVVNSGKVAFMLPVPEVMDRLIAEGQTVKVFVPLQSDKEDYRERYIERGSNSDFLERIDKNWDSWLYLIHKGNYDLKIVPAEKYLSDVIKVKQDENSKSVVTTVLEGR